MTTSNDVRVWTFLAAGAVAMLGATRPARGADDLVPAIQGVGHGAPPEAHRWQVAAGVRTSLLRSAGYDPFATSDVLAQFSTTVLWALPSKVTAKGTFTTAVGVLAEVGTSGATARGADTDLDVARGGLVLEERFAPLPWGYVFARVSPSVLSVEAKVKDAASPATLETSYSTFAFDSSLGLAANLNPGFRGVGLWLVGEGGYGWAPSRQLTLSPAVNAADASKAGVTSLGELAPRGMFFSAYLALTF